MDSNGLQDKLQLQLSELEMLNAMFPNPGELELTDPGAVSDINDFLSGRCGLQELTKLSYTIRIIVQQVRVSILIVLSASYPDERADVSVHCSSLSRSSHDQLERELRAYQDGLEPGALSVGSIVEWVQENLPLFCQTRANLEETKDETSKIRCRMWIQSHHIYSKTKIGNIEDWAAELGLNGFILAGKPGFVCVEGPEDCCQIWWQRVRGMNWQRISCKLEEKDDSDKFQGFANITALVTTKTLPGYLREHQSSHVFKELFGFEER